MTARSWLVVGGGLVGVASALRLQAAGFDVTLVDPGDARRGASFGNIGHIATEQCEPLASTASLLSFPGRLFAMGGPLDFRLRDLPLWAPWAVRFMAASRPAAFARGTETLTALLQEPLAAWERLLTLGRCAPGLVRPEGHAVVWMDTEHARAGIAAWRAARTGAVTMREMEPAELRAYGAALRRPPVAGLRFDGTGQVSEPQAVRDALLAAFTARGGRTVAAKATRLAAEADGGAVAHLDTGDAIRTEHLLVAAGAWSNGLMAGLGVRAPVIGERGYSMQSAEHAWPEDLPLTVFQERSMVIARFTGGLRAAGHVEFGRPDAAPDPRKWDRLKQHLDELGVAFSGRPDRWCGPRPTLPDYLPAIGRLKDRPQVFYAFGHQHLGLTLAAVTAELVEALALDRPPAVDLSPLAVERFG